MYREIYLAEQCFPPIAFPAILLVPFPKNPYLLEVTMSSTNFDDTAKTLDNDFYLKRQRMKRRFIILRLIIVVGLLGLIGIELFVLFRILHDVEDRTGRGTALVRTYEAAEDIHFGQVVSFTAEGQVRRGLGLNTVPLSPGRFAAACLESEFNGKLCLWKAVPSNSTIAQFRFLRQDPVSLQYNVMMTSGTGVADLAMMDLSATFSRNDDIRILSADVAVATGNFAVVLVRMNARGFTYYVARRVNGTMSFRTMLSRVDPEYQATGFVKYTAAGLLVGLQCQVGSCCVSLFNANLTTITSNALSISCPNAVHSIGAYVATPQNPVTIFRVSAASITALQTINLPWRRGDLPNMIALPEGHPSEQFVIVDSMGTDVRGFFIIANDTNGFINKTFLLRTGPVQQMESTLVVEGIAFLPSTLEVGAVVKSGNFKYAFKVSLAPTAIGATSVLMHVDDIIPANGRIVAFDPVTALLVIGAPGESSQFVPHFYGLQWIGGYSFAGIAQRSVYSGESCPVVIEGISGVHRGLKAFQKYTSGRYGELVPHRSAVLSSKCLAVTKSGGCWNTNQVLVGSAISEEEIYVFLH